MAIKQEFNRNIEVLKLAKRKDWDLGNFLISNVVSLLYKFEWRSISGWEGPTCCPKYLKKR